MAKSKRRKQMRATSGASKPPPWEDAIVTGMKRTVRKVERRTGAGDIGGTGQTVLKAKVSPLSCLVRDQRIGNEEIKAAAEILSVFMTISGSLLSGSMLRERISGGRGDQSLWVIEAHERYKAWADHWSVRKKRGDPTLEIVISAVIDERSFRHIERDLRLRNGRAAEATVNGLRDYAARAGWVTGQMAIAWLEAAARLFQALHPELRVAIDRARAADVEAEPAPA
jgi:hypothetical protein